MISEKMSCRLISRGKKHANKFLREKYPALKKISLITYNAEKKNLTPLYVGEKISNSRDVWEKILPIQTKSVKSPIPHSPTNVQWSCQPFNAPINGLPQDGGAGQPTGNLTFSGFQMSISPPLGLHCKSNSHPWGPQTFIVS